MQRMVFALPSKRCLSTLLQWLPLKPGITNVIFEKLKIPVSKMSELDKTCVLLFDKVSISRGLSYNVKKDHVLGFENDGVSVMPKFADHALVLPTINVIV